MNLAKKGTVLLAALSVFAITSCGAKGGTSVLEARDFLKDADTEKAKTTLIEKETFDWDINVTGTGMEPSEGKIGGAQLIIASLIWLNDDSDLSDFIGLLNNEKFKSLKGNYDDTYRVDTLADNYETAFESPDYFLNDIDNMHNTYDHKYSINGDLMTASFKREEELDLPGLPEENIPLLTFTEEIVYKKDGFSDHWKIVANKLPLKVDWEKQISQTQTLKVSADGTMSGSITATFHYKA